MRALGAPIALWETLLRGYSDPSALLLERRVTAFILYMLKVRGIAVPQRLLAMPLRRLRAPRRSAFFGDAVGSP